MNLPILINKTASKEFTALMNMINTDTSLWHSSFDIQYDHRSIFGTGLHLITELLEREQFADGLHHVAAFETSNLPDYDKIVVDGKLHMPVYNANDDSWLYVEIHIISGIYENEIDVWYTTNSELVLALPTYFNSEIHNVSVDGIVTNKQEIIDFMLTNESLYRNISKRVDDADAKRNAEDYANYLVNLLSTVLAGKPLTAMPKTFASFI